MLCLCYKPPQPPLKNWDSGVVGVLPAMSLEQRLPSDLAAVVPTLPPWLLETPQEVISPQGEGTDMEYKSLSCWPPGGTPLHVI